MFGSIGSALGISADAAFGGITSAAGELYKNQEAKRAAKRQMEFQAQMSNTGYQRAMADMKAAGLNPILAGKLGPASSPGGAMYQPGNIGQAFVQGVQGISSAQQALGSAAVSYEQAALTKEQRIKVEQEIKEILPAQAAKLTAEAKLANVNVDKVQVEKALKQLEVGLKELDFAGYEKLSKEFNVPLGPDTTKTAIAAFAAGTSAFKTLFDMMESLIPEKVPEWLKKLVRKKK